MPARNVACGIAGSVLLSAFAAAADSNSNDAPVVAGAATCMRDSERGPCYLSWTLPAHMWSQVFIERFDTDSDSWIAVGELHAGSRGRTPEPVAGGSLYRVSACYGSSAAGACIHTSVHWVPLLPASVDEIPERVDTPDGALVIPKNNPLRNQTQEYNVFLVAKLVAETPDFTTTMPPMTRRRVERPDFAGPDPTSEVDVIEWNVFQEYEVSRTRCDQSRE